MKKEWKKALQDAYRAPKPLKKRDFLDIIEEPEMTTGDFLRSQFGYIHKWNWLLALLLFVAALFAGHLKEPELVGIISSLTPLLALSTVAESSRSLRYGMEELELVSRFPLKAIVMARLGILGIGNLILLVILCPVLMAQGQPTFLSVGVQILIPYLITSFLNLFLVRKIPGRESLYYCAGIAVIVCVVQIIFSSLQSPIYERLRPVSWVVILALLFISTGRECLKMLKQSEEYIWNL